MNKLLVALLYKLGFEPIRHTLRDLVSNTRMDKNCVSWTPAVRNCLITECPEHIDDPDSYADCKLDPYRDGTRCTKRRTREWSYKSKTFMPIGERAERYKLGLNIGMGQQFMYGDDVWNCTDKCRSHHAHHSTGCTCPQEHIRKQLHVEEDGNIYKKLATKLKVIDPYKKILKQAGALKHGESTEIPHHIMTAALRTSDPSKIDYALTFQEMLEFADKISKHCGITLKFSDDTNTWTMCKK